MNASLPTLAELLRHEVINSGDVVKTRDARDSLADDNARPRLSAGRVRAAYVHVPFCTRRCGYCDFTLVAERSDLVEAYLAALTVELNDLPEPLAVDTLFLGGGTPTFLPPRSLQRLFDLLAKHLPLADGGEFTIEANPLDLLDPNRAAVIADSPVTRISLGIQSLDDAVLRTLERDHSRADVLRVWDRLQKSDLEDRQRACDLIFAVPGQSLKIWERTLSDVIGLCPDHVSAYGLTFEKGTAFWARRARGTLQELDDETQLAMYSAAIDQLETAGLPQYEISNFAREQSRCRHNLAYWDARPYAAFGPGGAWYAEGYRGTNHRSVSTWIKQRLSGNTRPAQVERLSPEAEARDLLWLRLRTRDGISRRVFEERTGYRVEDLIARPLAEHTAAGLLSDDGTSIRLTRAGLFVADSIFADCFES